MGKVTVVADKNGNLISVSPNNPEYGWIFVEQTIPQYSQGWLRNVTLKTRIMGKVKDFTEGGYFKGQTLPGKIVVKESFQPFNTENPDSTLKIAGDTGIPCRFDDQPIYRQTFYTTNVNDQDELIMHNNTEEIREVMRAQKELEILKVTQRKIEEPAEL